MCLAIFALLVLIEHATQNEELLAACSLTLENSCSCKWNCSVVFSFMSGFLMMSPNNKC